MSLPSLDYSQSNFQFTKSVGAQLIRKYQQKFSFYQVKPINEIIHGHQNRKTFIDLCDIRIYSQDAQFLRRFYFYRTLTGREEIYHRLKMCGQYYANNRILNYEYPMMVVTNTKSLFMKRNRRLRKIQAGEASSDESASENEDQLMQPQSYYILDDIDRMSVDQDEEQEFSYQDYDSSEHDIFEEQGQEQSFQSQKKQQLKNIQEQHLNHLIQDMTFKQIQKKLSIQGSNNLDLAQIIKSHTQTENQISVTSIDEGAIKSLNSREKPNYCKYLAQPIFEKLLNLSSYSQKFATPFIHKYQTPKMAKRQEIQREERRKKIRDKAQQLLKVVRSKQDPQMPLSS